MKKQINFYKTFSGLSTQPEIEITEKEILEVCPELAEYMAKREIYTEFCDKQTKTGQARKNERGNFRRKIFAGLEGMAALHTKTYDKIKNIKAKEVAPHTVVEIEFDGRLKNNLSKMIQGVTLYMNVGSISPQYYGSGLKNFKTL